MLQQQARYFLFVHSVIKMTSQSRILQLAEIISASVAKIQEGLTAKSLPTPSFDENAPPTLPLELVDVQDAVLDATAELQDLLMEPMLSIHGHGGVSFPSHRRNEQWIVS